MNRPKHLIRDLEDLPSEVRARFRLGDPTLILVRWKARSNSDDSLLEFVECLDEYETQGGWIEEQTRVRRFGEGVTSMVGGGMQLARRIWLDSTNAVWVEDDS